MLRSPGDTPLYRTLHVLVPLVFRPLFRMRVSGVEHLPREGAVLLASNHLSNIDPFFIGVACPRQVHFMAKAELWKVGALGRAVEALGGFAVRRGEADRESIRQALGYLKRGAVVGVFPEGHRQPEGCLGQPQAGAALLALQPGVTTVPVALTGTNRILANGRLRLPRVTVSFGPPVSPEDAGATKAQRHMEISTRVMQALADLLGQDWQRAEERS